MVTPQNYYHFAKQIGLNPRNLQYYEFIGKLFGKSIISKNYFVCPNFTLLLYKYLLDVPI
jgi:hypothetical protein